MEELSNQVLDILGSEFRAVVQSTRGNLQRLTLAELQGFMAQLEQLEGAAAISRVYGMARLFREARLALAAVDAGDKTLEDVDALLHKSLAMAEGLIGHVLESRTEIPCVLLPEMTALRRFLGEPPLYEYHLLQDVHWPAFDIDDDAKLLSARQDQDIKRLHRLYQMGLLDVIRDNHRPKALAKLFRIAARLHEMAGAEVEKRYWWVFASVAKALAENKLSLEIERIRLLAAVEKQLRVLVAGTDGQRSAYPEGLWRAFVSLLAMTDTASEAGARAIGVPELGFTDSTVSAIRRAISGESATIKSMFDAIGASTGAIRALLEASEESDFVVNPRQLGDLRAGFELLAEECDSAGLKLLASGSRSSSRSLQALETGGDVALPVDLLTELTDGVFYVECALAEFRGRSPDQTALADWEALPRQEVLKSNLIKTAFVASVDEMALKLGEIKDLVDDVASGVASDSVLDDLVGALQEISGTAAMLRLDRFAGLNRLGVELAERLFGAAEEAPDKALESFADGIICLEYYLDGCFIGDSIDEKPLDLAQECLDAIAA